MNTENYIKDGAAWRITDWGGISGELPEPADLAELCAIDDAGNFKYGDAEVIKYIKNIENSREKQNREVRLTWL